MNGFPLLNLGSQTPARSGVHPTPEMYFQILIHNHVSLNLGKDAGLYAF